MQGTVPAPLWNYVSMRSEVPNDKSAVLSERCLTSSSHSDKVMSDAVGLGVSI